MKRADLEKSKGKKIEHQPSPLAAHERFGRGASGVVDRREQRKLDQAQGLIPFAVKLHGDLVKQLHAQAQERGLPLGDLVGELLKKGLSAR